MYSVNEIEISNQDSAGAASHSPLKAALQKSHKETSGLKQAAIDKYRDFIRREKKSYNDKKWKKVKEERKQSTGAEPCYRTALKESRSIREFECLNKIDEGAYGVVYRVRDKSTDDIVALKQLKALKETEGLSIAAERELNTLLKLKHPNIVAGWDIAVSSKRNHVYVVMEYVPHQLRSFLETMRQNHLLFGPEHVKCLMSQLQRAVQYLHTNHIIHRDLKTHNILLSQDGVLKLADFGMTREYGFPLQQYTPGVCTRWYRAPELLLLSPQYSTPIDMWSIGCIFGLSLLEGLLTYNPARRVTAAAALEHAFFKEQPVAIEPAMFPMAMQSEDSGQYSATEPEEDCGSHP
ncbi:serine/threonine-protein kinase PITSLRE-like [Spodoptera frugiperda]|uniref:Serine/threonine-protein kinase PITSLRE-like n=1 Tax=Spodoptera frugiperda TaxID=7108 RepID=A0A9R0EX72_SPOFR|nr:serine/threonine-protein kinase PITSLRE-like [Spodoptera frugiperda]